MKGVTFADKKYKNVTSIPGLPYTKLKQIIHNPSPLLLSSIVCLEHFLKIFFSILYWSLLNKKSQIISITFHSKVLNE